MKPNIQVWSVEDVKPYEANAKKHPPEQIRRIAKSIKEFGWTQAISVDKDGVIIAGHGRRLAAMELGLKQVPVWVRDDLTPEQVRAARLADNRVAESEIDTNLLQAELRALDFDLSGIFDDKELAFLDADLAELNADAFVADLDAEVERQAEETRAKIKEVDERTIRLDQAFGFKSIKGADERAIAMFMAQIESETGKEGAEALVEHVKTYRGK
jgi:ParB-like chromosome segregation protein Spo0J